MTDKISLQSADPNEERLHQLRSLFPDAIVEGKIDFDKLKAVIGDAVDSGLERYGLTWAGKSEAVRAIQYRSDGTLKPARGESIDFDTTGNLIIEGDNLEVLRLLQRSYFGKVKMIYIDPPYNTGNDFIYPDNYRDSLGDYLRFTGQKLENGAKKSTNGESSGRHHSKWLSMMYPRLFLAKNLLREDGVIFVSIDDHEVHNLRAVMDEIFGEENFIGQLAVQLNPRGRHLDQFIAKTHEYIVIYARSSDQEPIASIPKDDRMLKEYRLQDSRGKYRELELRNRNPLFNRQTRPNLYYPIYVNPEDNSVALMSDETHQIKVEPKNSRNEDSCWTWGTDKFRKQIDLLTARQSESNSWRIFRKDYLISSDGKLAETLPKSLWLHPDINNDYGKKAVQDLFGTSTDFSFPKSYHLIRRLLEIGAPDEESIILDFFAGSGTTAQAVLEQNKADGGNRKFILVQLPEPTGNKQFPTIAEITKERVRRVIKKLDEGENGKLKMGDEAPQDRGFKVLKLAESNFNVWDGDHAATLSPGELAEQLAAFATNLKPGVSQEDVLFEILLKDGYDLSARREEIDVGDCKAWSVDGGRVIVFTGEFITLEAVRAVAALHPEAFICLDTSFHGNDQLLTNTELQMRDAQIQFRTV